jgi:hypothetical protein
MCSCMCVQYYSEVVAMDLDNDDFAELGIPSPLECWKQQAHLLAMEVHDLQKDLSNARHSIHKLVIMHSDATKERDLLALEVTRVKWELSDRLLAESQEATKKMNAFGSAYGRTDGKP